MINAALAEQIADALAADGYSIIQQALPDPLVAALAERATSCAEQNYAPAGIGRQIDKQHNVAIRNDAIRWIERDNDIDAQYLNWMETLRRELNARLYLGLFDFESHYAHYAPGAFYKKHVDAFRGQSNRIISTVLYLNKNWPAIQGGHLCIYSRHDAAQKIVEILPEYGRFVIFLSADFPHEVMPATTDRYSIPGWFRLNNSTGARVDPA